MRTKSLERFNGSKPFIEYSNDMDNIYKNIEQYHPNINRKTLIVIEYMIADMLSNKKLNPIVTKLFIRGRKLSISFVLLHSLIFFLPKNIRLNSMYYFIIKISNK